MNTVSYQAVQVCRLTMNTQIS